MGTIPYKQHYTCFLYAMVVSFPVVLFVLFILVMCNKFWSIGPMVLCTVDGAFVWDCTNHPPPPPPPPRLLCRWDIIDYSTKKYQKHISARVGSIEKLYDSESVFL